MKPTNLRIVSQRKRTCAIEFDGDVWCNDYVLYARSLRQHGHQPLVDDPTGNPRRRTWTQVGGYDYGSGQSRTQASAEIILSTQDMPDDPAPWQLMINNKSDHTGRTHSNAVIWQPDEG